MNGLFEKSDKMNDHFLILKMGQDEWLYSKVRQDNKNIVRCDQINGKIEKFWRDKSQRGLLKQRSRVYWNIGQLKCRKT